MSDNTPAPEPAQANEGENPEPKADETDWKAEARKWEQRAKENKGAAEKLAQIEEANKTELQRIQERAEAAEKRAQTLELENLKAAVAADKGLSLKQAKRLVGATREELEKDADEILADFAPAQSKPRPESKKLKSGSSSGEQGGGSRAAAAVRALRNQ